MFHKGDLVRSRLAHEIYYVMDVKNHPTQPSITIEFGMFSPHIFDLVSTILREV